MKKQSNRIPDNSKKPWDSIPHTQLKRRPTHRQIAMTGLPGALGTGLFLESGPTIPFVGPATIVSYCLAGMVALAVVWALVEIVPVYPIPGGHEVVAASFPGKSDGYLARWDLAIKILVAVGAEVTASATHLQHQFPGLHIGMGTVLCSLFIVGLNLATVRLYGFAEYWFSMIKVTAVVVLILLGVSLTLTGSPVYPESVGLSHLTAHGDFAPLGLIGILLAICVAAFSFGSIENVSIVAAKSENPSRSIPHVTKTMIRRLLLFYVLGTGVILALQDWQETVKVFGNAKASPFMKVMGMIGIPAAGYMMNAVLLIAALSAANGCLYSGSRMIHPLILDRMTPAFAAHTAKNGASRGAVTLVTLRFVVASVPAIVSPAEAFMCLYGRTTVGVLVTWVIIMLAHLKSRKHCASITDERPPVRSWGYSVVNWLVISISIAVFVALPWAGLAMVWYAGIPYLVTLVVFYLVLPRVSHLPEPAPLEIHCES